MVSSIMNTSSLAVVIPTKNRPADLVATVHSLFEQTILPEQLVIVDQSTNGESQHQVEESFRGASQNVRNSIKLCYVLDPKIRGACAARNRALAFVCCDIVLVLDDDVILEKDFIEEILRVHMHYPHATAIGGIITNYEPPAWLLRWWNRLFVRGPFHDDRQSIYWRARNKRDLEPARVTRLGSGLMSFRMSAIGDVRFDENIPRPCFGEDVDFCVRLGSKALFLIAPGARLEHKKTVIARPQESFLLLHARPMMFLYLKNWNTGIKNRLSFLWLLLGYAVVASALCVRRLSFQPVRDLLSSVRESRDLLSDRNQFQVPLSAALLDRNSPKV